MSGPDSGGSDDEADNDDPSSSNGPGTPDEQRHDTGDTGRTDEYAGEDTNRQDGSDRAERRRQQSAAGDRSPSDRPPAENRRTGATDPQRDGRSTTAGPAGPGRTRENDNVTIADDGFVRWYLKTDDETVAITRDVLSSVAIVAVIGLLLFGISGIWPPLVAVESGSMEPNMERGDLVFVVDNERFVGDDPIDGTGVVPLDNGQESGHDKFGQAGDVIVFQPDGSELQTPVIHRAHFWVEEGENWVETKADEDVIGGATCNQVTHCPADHAGFVTKGDANQGYDQHTGHVSDVVKPEWITGKASFRIPWLGHVRLAFDDLLASTAVPSPVIETSPVPLDDATVQASLAGATGFAGIGAGAAMAIGRRRY